MTRGPGAPLALGLSLVVLAACGGSTPPAQAPPLRVTPVASAEPAPPPLAVEYVVIHRAWVQRVLPVQPAHLEAWSAAPENAGAVSGAFRHIVFKVPGGEKDPGLAAKKKAQAALDRLKKGEDLGKLAKQLSEDPATKDAGGEVPAAKVEELPAPLKSAFAALAPGQTTTEPVRSPEGWHVVRKDRASEEQIERAYRKTKAGEVAKKLAGELLARLKSGAPARAAIAEAVEVALGERGLNDANRPTASVVDRERLQQVRLPAAAKAALETFARSAHPGDALPSPAVDGETIVVARAKAPAAE